MSPQPRPPPAGRRRRPLRARRLPGRPPAGPARAAAHRLRPSRSRRSFFALWGPVVLAAGLAGAIVDRFENRALLVGVSFAQAACVAGIALERRPRCGRCCRWSRCSASASRSASRRSSRSCPPRPARPTSRRANGLMETARSLGFTAGPLLGGVLGAAGLLRLALAVDALSFVVVGLAAPRPAGAPAAGRRGRDEPRPRPRRLRLPRSTTAPSRSPSAARSPRSPSSPCRRPPSRSS